MAGREWPLVGRTDELDFVTRAMDAGERAVLVSGAAGVGKSRLAAEVVRRAAGRGWRTHSAVATVDASRIPFGALAHLIAADLPGGADQLTVLRHLAERLAADQKKRMLLVDDAHLLDAGSAALLHQLVRTGSVFVLGTVRSGESTPDAIAAVRKEERTLQLEVQPLSEEEVARLLREVLGGAVEARTSRELARITAGNALFLHGLVSAGLDDGRLASRDGLWRWHGPMAPSGGLKSVIADRLFRLGKAEREVVELVALAEPVSAALIERAASAAGRRTLATSELLSEVSEGNRVAVRLRHPLYAETVRADTAPLRARALTRLLADTLETMERRRHDDVLRLAAWRLNAGQQPSLEVSMDAARRAIALLDSELAETLARTALAQGGGFEAQRLLAEALATQGRVREAADEQATLAAMAGNDRERATAAIALSTSLAWGLKQPGAADRVMRQAAEHITDGRALVELDAFRLRVLQVSRPLGEVAAHAASILANPNASPEAQLQCRAAAALAYLLSGRIADATRLMDEMRHASGADQGAYEQRIAQSWWLFLMFSGRGDEIRPLWEELSREASAGWLRSLQFLMSPWVIEANLFTGRPATALLFGREADVYLRERDPWGSRGVMLSFMANAAALLGDVAAAESLLAEAEDIERAQTTWMGFPLLTARAWVRAVQGDLDAARSCALEAANRCRDWDVRMFELVALHACSRLGGAAEVVERLVTLACDVEGELASLCADHAKALLRADGGALEETAQRFESMRMTLDAAEACAEAAAIFQKEGRAGKVRAARTRARSLLSACEGAMTPALSGLEQGDDLTAREHQIALLAARGTSSASIAQQLGMSVRTVENHLQTVYSKLEVHGRRELVAALSPRAPGA